MKEIIAMTCDSNVHNRMHTRFCPDCGDRIASETVRISTIRQLRETAQKLGVRSDWYEPDEQEVTATVEGWIFNNAGFWPNANCSENMIEGEASELCVKLHRSGQTVAVINLATLFAMACRSDRD